MLNVPVRASGSHRQAGLTLIELLVAVAVIAVGAKLAAPQLSKTIAGYGVRNAADNVLNGLNYARAEALRRNSPVSFSLTGGSGWAVAQVTPSATLQSRSNNDSSGTTLTSSNTTNSVTFLPTGLLQAGSQMSEITVSNAVDLTNSRRINIFGGGLIRMCDPALRTANDPRRC